MRRWAKRNKVKLCFTPTYASWANPIETHFGPLRQFTLANSNHRSHPAQTQALHRYLRWRVRGYDPDRHLLGAAYLFLRGMGADAPTPDGSRPGIVWWRPPTAAIHELDHLFAEGSEP